MSFAKSDRNRELATTDRTSPSPVDGTSRTLAWPLAFTGVFLTLGFVSHARSNLHLAWAYMGVAAFVLCWQLALFARARQTGRGFAWEFAPVRSHYVQALVQGSIYIYWGWYWRNVYSEAPLILSQVALLYIVDALLSWSRGQRWRLGFGPWPIVFSTNLFMWFRDDWFVFQFLMIMLGVFGKHLIRWQREGRLTHIFNPSAFALTTVSWILIFNGATGHTWGEQIALTQGLPPHLYSEIFLCGVVVQYFFSVTLLTFSAAAALAALNLIYTQSTGVYLFIDSNIPIAVFLGLHLLMTDPATTPRSSLGKIMFGSLYGCGVFWAFILLRDFNVPDFYDKLLVVPILNLLTPLLDRLAALGAAGKFRRWEESVGPHKMNLAFMGGWTALFLAMLATGFVESPHPGATLAFWEKAAEANRPRAVENLRTLLADFERRNVNDPAEAVLGMGPQGAINREQALGIECNQVGWIYASGKYVPADPAKAACYFEKACEFGNTEGCANLAVEYFRTNLAGAQVNIERALSTLEQSSAVTNDGRICFLIGYACETGQGRPLDKVKARQFYEKAAVLGKMDGWKSLAKMQLAGEGGPPDHAGAALWLQKAADAGDGPSCLYLARLYHLGDGVQQDEPKAVALLQKACNLGVEPACQLLQQNRQNTGTH